MIKITPVSDLDLIRDQKQSNYNVPKETNSISKRCDSENFWTTLEPKLTKEVKEWLTRE